MRRTRRSWIGLLGVLGTVLPATWCGATGVAAAAPAAPCVSTPQLGRCPAWVSAAYQAPANQDWLGPAGSVTGSPDGRTVVADPAGTAIYAVATVRTGASFRCTAGTTQVSEPGQDVAVLAWSAADGSLLWQRIEGPFGADVVAEGAGIVVAADGSRVFATGFAAAPCQPLHEVTIGLDARTGADDWVAQVPDAELSSSMGNLVAAGAAGDLYVAGTGYAGPHPTTSAGYVRRLDQATGDELWRTDGVDGTTGSALALDTATGEVFGGYQDHALVGSPIPSDEHVGTDLVAYDGRSGAALWSVHDMIGGGGGITDVGVAPDGSRVYTLTCDDNEVAQVSTTRTRALTASRGAPLWESDYAGPGGSSCPSNGGNLVVTPDGSRVVEATTALAGPSAVPGVGSASTGSQMPVTLAYDSASGAPLWQAAYQQTPADTTVLAGATDGSAVYLAARNLNCNTCGAPPQFTTVAYATAGGAQQWQALFGNAGSEARGVVAVPGSGRVVVAGDEDQCGVLDETSPQSQAVVAVAYDPAGEAAPSLGSAPVAAANCGVGPSPAVLVPELPALPLVPLEAAPALWLARRSHARKIARERGVSS